MPKLELTAENIKDLRSIDRFPRVGLTVYGLVLQTQLAIEGVRNAEELGQLLQCQRQQLFRALKSLPKDDTAIYKVDGVITNLCLRARAFIPTSSSEAKIITL